MISSATPPLKLDCDCIQVSCHFNKDLFQDDTADALGITLPADLNKAVQKRKAEFIAGRYCASQALRQLGDNITTETGIGKHRAPVWPPGVVGSITHTHDYASAVVATDTRIRAVGLDSETWITPGTMDNISQQILTATETRSGHAHLFESTPQYLTLVFSAKESVFKCLFPLVNRFFDFHAAIIIPEPSASGADGRFRFELQENLSTEFHAGFSGYGVYAIDKTGVHTAVVLKV